MSLSLNVVQTVKQWRLTSRWRPPGPRRRRTRSCWQRWTSSPSSSNLDLSVENRLKPNTPQFITNVYTISLFLTYRTTLLYRLYSKEQKDVVKSPPDQKVDQYLICFFIYHLNIKILHPQNDPQLLTSCYFQYIKKT